jgi:hypothetical protein
MFYTEPFLDIMTKFIHLFLQKSTVLFLHSLFRYPAAASHTDTHWQRRGISLLILAQLQAM